MEQYKCLALSTAHLTKKDAALLSDLSSIDPMVMSRDTGFFIKLYDDQGGGDDLNYKGGYSPDLRRVISYAISHGHRLIEFDNDVEIHGDVFAVHDW